MTAAQLELGPSPTDGGWARTTGVVDGPQAFPLVNSGTGATATAVDDTNYLQRRGVHSGHNTLELSFETYDGAQITKLAVYDDTAIEWTAVSPDQLSLELSGPNSPVAAGAVFEVH